ncbi:hypothetical protein [Patulibacter minatonensis]|uniref:hypothetical protein n=1 Tax=Patulibacter minatonensis TaxID=298163 RepID=UPI0004AEC95B|nr:hypothetical protein [Patulibacter minatonensis]
MLIVLLLLVAWVAVNVALLGAVAYADRSGQRRVVEVAAAERPARRAGVAATGR